MVHMIQSQLRILNDSLRGGRDRLGQTRGHRHVEKGQEKKNNNPNPKQTNKTKIKSPRQDRKNPAWCVPVPRTGEKRGEGAPLRQHAVGKSSGPFRASVFTSASPLRKPTPLFHRHPHSDSRWGGRKSRLDSIPPTRFEGQRKGSEERGPKSSPPFPPPTPLLQGAPRWGPFPTFAGGVRTTQRQQE